MIGLVFVHRSAVVLRLSFRLTFNLISPTMLAPSQSQIQPHILSAKSATNAADSPTYSQAINSPHAEKWWEAMESELTTLESDLLAWELVPREPWMHVLPST